MARWHYEYNLEFKAICDNQNFNTYEDFSLEDLPYFPVTLFKKFELLSVPKEEIKRTLYSSSTSGNPSKIFLDETTSKSQIKALNNIMADFVGNKRIPFLIFDTEETIKNTSKKELSSRGTAIRGFLGLMKNAYFILDKDLKINERKLSDVLLKILNKEKVCFFGFTWLIYSICNNKNNKGLIKLFKSLKNNKNILLHIGGWKKLQDLKVDKEKFNRETAKFLSLNQKNIIDFYGMTEQLGTVYPDCSAGYKHVPLYSEIIIRDLTTLQPKKFNQSGFIQLISPLPKSYPGISILSDDLGKIIGIDDCKCKRKGKYFIFERRSEKAELKGCGDTFKI